MSSSGLLIALLALAYLGSVGSRHASVRALPGRWSLFLVVGCLLGPSAFGVLEANALEDFAAVGRVGAAWLALVTGLALDVSSLSAVRRAVSGVVVSAVAAVALGFAAWYGATRYLGYLADDGVLIAVGVGVLLSPCASLWLGSAESAPDSSKPVSLALLQVSRSSVLLPVVGAAVLLAFAPGHGLMHQSLAARVGVTLATGVVLGLLAVALLGREFRSAESWGLLLGLTLLGSGAAERVGLSAVSVAFFLGLTVAVLSPHREEIRVMITPTEPSVLLPVALLAGAALRVEVPWLLLIAALCVVRVVVDWLRGNLLRLLVPSTRAAGPHVGLALSMPGAMLLALTVELHERLPSSVAGGLLAASVIAALLGDVLASTQLRRSLTAAGEFRSKSSPPDPPSLLAQPESAQS